MVITTTARYLLRLAPSPCHRVTVVLPTSTYLRRHLTSSTSTSPSTVAVTVPSSDISSQSESEQQLYEQLEEARQQIPTNVSLNDMLEMAKNAGPATFLYSANFLRREIPIRIARQLSRLEQLPYGMCIMPSILRVRSWYAEAFREIRQFSKPLRTSEEQDRFTSCLESHYKRLSGLHFMMARGLHELKQQMEENSKAVGSPGSDLSLYPELHEQLDRFYLSRVGIRTLLAHHLEIQKPHRRGHAGIICVETCPHEVAQDAIASASLVCNRTFNRAPKVSLHGKRRSHFPYVPSHIYYILFELLKNSMKATAEFHKDAETLPPIRVVIADGKHNEDCAIKISDEGGGMPRSVLPRAWSYLYSTSPIDFGAFETMNDFDNESPMAGLGVGLPISRVYAKYFRGDLQLLSMESYGTDAYVHLHRLGTLPEPSIPGTSRRASR